MNDQFSHHMEKSKLIAKQINWLGFYSMGALSEIG